MSYDNDGGDRKPRDRKGRYGDKKSYGDGKPYGERKSYGDKPRGDRKPYGDRPRGEGRSYGDRKPYGERKSYGDKPRGDRPQGDGESFGEKKSYGDRPQGERRSYGDKPRGDRKPYGDRPRGEGRSYGDRKPYGERKSYGDKPRGDRKPYGDRPQGERRSFGDRPRGDRRGGRDYGDRKPYGDRGESRGYDRNDRNDDEPRKYLLPTDPSRLLSRGIDCQIKGNNNLALIMFLHGSVMMSEGCENNAARILRDIGKDNYADTRSEIASNCSEDALIEFDYLCITSSKDYKRTAFDAAFDDKNIHAIYRKICMEEIEGDDPVIETFASAYQDNSDKVVKGLEILKRKKDSVSAENHLLRIEDNVKLRQSVFTIFNRSMNGDVKAAGELKAIAGKVPEAAFFSEFLDAKASGKEIEWLRSKYENYGDLIIMHQSKFKIENDPFGTFLKAKSLESKKEEWISTMIYAAKAGSPEAIDELTGKMFRNDVRKCLAGIYLADRDLQKLVFVYQSGLEEMYYLDQYCGTDEQAILEVGRELGKQSFGKEIDWLKDHYDKGFMFCKDALVEKASDDLYHGKKLIYALHDVGEDMESAKLYLSMEGDPEIPSVKWLKKVCTSDEVTEFIKAHFEAKDDLATFESIFADDGYEHRPKRSSGGFGKKPYRGRR